VDKNPLIAKLNKSVPGAVLETRRFGRSGVISLWLEAEAIAKVAKVLKSDVDLKLDWLENLSLVEFEDVLVATYFLASSTIQQSLILRISAVPESPMDRVCFPSTRSVWPMVEPMEKEAEELFGVSFQVDPKIQKTEFKANLLPENWIGFPLRKGYVFPKEVYGLPHSRTKQKDLQKKVVPR
jgi:NADH:ubiquinone oxidoreductase subunit C